MSGITIRPANQDERSAYLAVSDHDLIVAVDDAGLIVGWCEYAADTIYLIESYRRGAGTAMVKSLPHVSRAYYVAPDAQAFWEKLGYRPIPNGDWLCDR